MHTAAVFDDFMRVVCGDARSVSAVEATPPRSARPGLRRLCLRPDRVLQRAIGSLQSSVSNLVACRRGYILGTRGSLAFDAQAGVIEYATAGGLRERIDLSGADDDEGVRSELRSFVDWIDHDAPPLVTGQDGLRVVEIIDAAYRCMRERRAIALPLLRAGRSGDRWRRVGNEEVSRCERSGLRVIARAHVSR